MNTQFKKYTGVLLVSSVLLGGIATAAITPIPTISNTFAVAGQVIKSADINKLAEAINLLDVRTNGSQDFDFGSKKGINLVDPVANTDAINKQYLEQYVYDALRNYAPPGWVNVMLTDTDSFNTTCQYRYSDSRGYTFQAPTNNVTTAASQIKVTSPDSSYCVVSNNTRTVEKCYSNNPTVTLTVTKIEKLCP